MILISKFTTPPKLDSKFLKKVSSQSTLLKTSPSPSTSQPLEYNTLKTHLISESLEKLIMQLYFLLLMVTLFLAIITFKYKLKLILTIPMVLVKDSIKDSDLEMENGPFLTETEVNVLIKELACKHMDIILSIYKEKVRNTSTLTISEAQMRWMLLRKPKTTDIS